MEALLHYHNNPRGKRSIDISTAFTAIALVVVALRIYTRFFLVRYAGTEDYMIIAAMVCSIGLTICIGFQSSWGLGLHGTDLTPEDTATSMKAFWASLIVYYLSLGLTKAAIILQYRRIFTHPKFNIASWCVMGVVVCYTIWAVFGSIFACVPVRAFWTTEPANCIDQFIMWFTNAAINILTDLAIIILPMPVIQSLNLPRRQKQALIAIFTIGSFVCIVSILRLKSLVAISNSKDPTYDNPPAASWSSVETNVGIICSCLPLLRPLVTHYLPRIFRITKRSTLGPSRGAPQLFQSTHSVCITHHDKDDDYDIEMLKPGWPLSEPSGNIQVVTNIQVKIEGGDNKWSGWRTPTSETLDMEARRDSSVEDFVERRGDV